MVDTSEEALLLPDWLKLRMIRSEVPRLVDAGTTRARLEGEDQALPLLWAWCVFFPRLVDAGTAWARLERGGGGGTRPCPLLWAWVCSSCGL